MTFIDLIYVLKMNLVNKYSHLQVRLMSDIEERLEDYSEPPGILVA
jgi:hypothetical protein